MISIVVPLYNEQDSLRELISRIDNAISFNNLGPYEILLFDDGSTDRSWKVIQEICASERSKSDADHRSIKAFRFRRNFGKAAALSAGFERAKGDFIITMDADLQDDPAEIPRLLSKLEEGYDVVSGWKQTRYDPWHKRYPSLVFNGILRSATKLHLHDFNCGLKAYRREVTQEVQLYGEMHRFIPVLAHARGYRVTEIAVQHHPRIHGVSKYGVSRILKGFLDLFTVVFLTRFRFRPQHVLGTIGVATCSISVLLFTALCFLWLITRILDFGDSFHLTQSPLFYLSTILFLAGLQFLSTGLLAELVVANATPKLPPYSIGEVILDSKEDA